MSRFLKAFITVSVLLNILMAGIIIGDTGRYFVSKRKHLTVQEIAMALPADKRSRMQASITHDDQDIAALRQQLDEARIKATLILKSPAFDKTAWAAYAAQVQEIQRLKIQILQRMSGAIVSMAMQATPQERVAMADILSKP